MTTQQQRLHAAGRAVRNAQHIAFLFLASVRTTVLPTLPCPSSIKERASRPFFPSEHERRHRHFFASGSLADRSLSTIISWTLSSWRHRHYVDVPHVSAVVCTVADHQQQCLVRSRATITTIPIDSLEEKISTTRPSAQHEKVVTQREDEITYVAVASEEIIFEDGF